MPGRLGHNVGCRALHEHSVRVSRSDGKKETMESTADGGTYLLEVGVQSPPRTVCIRNIKEAACVRAAPAATSVLDRRVFL